MIMTATSPSSCIFVKRKRQVSFFNGLTKNFKCLRETTFTNKSHMLTILIFKFSKAFCHPNLKSTITVRLLGNVCTSTPESGF